MPQMLDSSEMQTLLAALGGDYDIELPSGTVRLLARSLPGTAVCALLDDLGDGVTRIAYDMAKPHAILHVQAMVQECWENYTVPVAFPDGAVELMRRLCPTRRSGPAHVAVVPAAV